MPPEPGGEEANSAGPSCAGGCGRFPLQHGGEIGFECTQSKCVLEQPYDVVTAETAMDLYQLESRLAELQLGMYRRRHDLQRFDDLLEILGDFHRPIGGVAARHDVADLEEVGRTGVELVGDGEKSELA